MINFKEYISERKQVGNLYHFTDTEAIEKILNTNMMTASDKRKYISFSRDYGRSITPYFASYAVRIMFDGDKLSDKFKIEQFHDKEIEGDLDQLDSRTYLPNEFEERIKTKGITDIRKYIKQIDIRGLNKTIWGNNPYEEIAKLGKKYKIKVNDVKKWSRQ